MASSSDLTTILSISSTALLTTYVAGTACQVERGLSVIGFWLEATEAAAGSSLSSIEFKIQLSYDGTNFVDYSTRRPTIDTPAEAVEHSIATTAATTARNYLVSVESHRGARWFRCLAKGTGGVGVAGDSAVVKASIVTV